MKTFKTLMLFVALMGFVGTGCKKDPCKDVTCQNGGVCNDGTCQCATGYQGTNCETEVRAKFLGTYNVSESCSPSGNFNYQISITSSGSNVSNVIISNFYDIGVSVIGSVNGNQISIASQTVSAQGLSFTISGSGQISGSIMTLSYTVSFSGQADVCTATCTKQ